MNGLNKIFLFFFFLLLPDQVIPQSWELIGGPTGIPVNDEIFTKDGRILCSTAKGVFISDDSGDNWRISSPSQNYNGIYSLTERSNGEIIPEGQKTL